MKLTSIYFFAFVLVTCLVYYLVPKKVQWVVLLASSMVFFVMSSGVLTVYMLATTAIVYGGALWLNKHREAFESNKKELDKAQRKEAKKKLKKEQKLRVAAIAVVVLGILVVLKYCNLGVEIANLFMRLFHLVYSFEMFSIVLPLGISYYTLMAVSYVTDVYRGIIKAEKNPLRVLLFVSYFPHIVEGPFDRYKDLREQFNAPHRFDYDNFCKGIILVLFGLFKKMVIADRLGITVSEIFTNSNEHTGPAIVIATVMYTIQLYCDFSGCIDIISGVSELFGIKVAENFRQPFFSKSINEFWRRWHITLGLWLKEYVYYPVILSGHFKAVDKFAKKHLKSQHLINVIPAAYALFFVWFSNGLWHGASLKYILYGLYYYFLMMLGELCKPLFEKLKAKMHIKDENKPFALFQMLRTFVIVNIGMLLFRSATVGEFFALLKQAGTSINYLEGAKEIMFLSKGLGFAFFGIVVVFVVSLVKEKNHTISLRDTLYQKSYILRYSIVLFLLIFTIVFGIYGSDNAATFVYAQF